MDRKRLTQRFPFLFPMRQAQRKMCFYAGMRFDGCCYVQTIGEKPLPHLLFETDCALYNYNTGFDMIYRENKVFNLKLAAKTLNGLLIRPGETFSFWWLVRHADKDTPYKDGFTVTNGKLTTMSGGGMCQMSNLLFWMFLHTPLTIIQRSGHEVKEFPEPNSDEIKRVDATISEGWIDCRRSGSNPAEPWYLPHPSGKRAGKRLKNAMITVPADIPVATCQGLIHHVPPFGCKKAHGLHLLFP